MPKPEKNERQEAVERAADVIRNVVDETLLPVMKDDVVGFALMMNTARIVSAGIVKQNPEAVANQSDLSVALSGDIQKVVLRYLRRYGIKVTGDGADEVADIGDGKGGVDQYKLRAAVDRAIEELDDSIEDLCLFYGGQIVGGAMFAIIGQLASDALVMFRERQGGPGVKVAEANRLVKAATDAVHQAYCRTLHEFGVEILSMDVTAVPPINPTTN